MKQSQNSATQTAEKPVTNEQQTEETQPQKVAQYATMQNFKKSRDL